MNKIVLFDPSLGTLNLGDHIIMHYLMDEMNFLFESQSLVHYSTHQPISRAYQTVRKNTIYKTCRNSKFRFLCGSNLFKNSLLRISPDWSIDYSSCEYYRDSISIGCGMDMNAKKTDFYTKLIYKKILSPHYIHSVRDERTKRYLESLGFKVINTGCPTMWELTEEVCNKIPRTKANRVIFTLSDDRDFINDQKLIDILLRAYSQVFFWPQGYNDYDYLTKLNHIEDIHVLPRNLREYIRILNQGNIDYVGIRLHGGICAMCNGVRTIIISFDNRTEDMKETYGFNFISREKIESLTEVIQSKLDFNINVSQENIKEWKSQFK